MVIDSSISFCVEIKRANYVKNIRYKKPIAGFLFYPTIFRKSKPIFGKPQLENFEMIRKAMFTINLRLNSFQIVCQ
ncbi:MAG: hypothetical protein C0430_00040 [Flavobacterium sp.]|nr:hypothetical protein [Flavobacterium sp.]